MLPLWRLRLLFVSALLLAVPAPCAAPEAILHSGSGSTVDSTAAFDGMRIYSGQHVRTPEGRFSELLTQSTTIRALGNSNLEFRGDSAELLEGGVALNTSSHFPIRCGCATVIPAKSAKARYVVQLQQKTVYVTAEEGDVLVKSEKRSKNVSTGKTVAVFCEAAPQDIVFTGSNTPAKVVFGISAASAGAAPVIMDNLSGTSPDR